MIPDEIQELINRVVDEKMKQLEASLLKHLEKLIRQVEINATEIKILKEGDNL